MLLLGGALLSGALASPRKSDWRAEAATPEYAVIVLECVQEDTVMVLVVSLLIVAVTTAALYAIAQWRPSLPASSSRLTYSCVASPAPDNSSTHPSHLQAN